MGFSDADLAAIWLTIRIAGTTTLILLLLGTPLALWLAETKSRLKGPISAIVALPLILPPTVLGFYLLLALGPNGPVGKLTLALGLGTPALYLLGTGRCFSALFPTLCGTAHSKRHCWHRSSPT